MFCHVDVLLFCKSAKYFQFDNTLNRDPEKSSSGKKFESPKKSNFFFSNFFLQFFFVHMEAAVLQQWQTTHFKACCK